MFRLRGPRARLGIGLTSVALAALATGSASASDDNDDLCRAKGNGAAIYNYDTGAYMYTLEAGHDMRVQWAEDDPNGWTPPTLNGHTASNGTLSWARGESFVGGSCKFLTGWP